MFTDSHAHLNASEFKQDWKNTVNTAKNAGLSTIINIGSDLLDSEWGVTQAHQEPIVYPTIGIHPEHLEGQTPDMVIVINNLRRLIKSSTKVVGIGELGLDYTLDMQRAPKQAQVDLITPQITLAIEQQLPIVMHVRDQPGSDSCFNDTIKLFQQFTTSNSTTHESLQVDKFTRLHKSSSADSPLSSTTPAAPEHVRPEATNSTARGEARPRAGGTDHHLQPTTYNPAAPEHGRGAPSSSTTHSNTTLPTTSPPAGEPQPTTQLSGVFHCWTGTPEQAQQALNLGFYISFSGIVTYKSAGHILDAARVVPDERLLIETDSPFLTPEPARSKEHPAVNQPKYVILTAEKLAAIRQTSVDHIAKITTQNAHRLFKLPNI